MRTLPKIALPLILFTTTISMVVFQCFTPASAKLSDTKGFLPRELEHRIKRDPGQKPVLEAIRDQVKPTQIDGEYPPVGDINQSDTNGGTNALSSVTQQAKTPQDNQNQEPEDVPQRMHNMTGEHDSYLARYDLAEMDTIDVPPPGGIYRLIPKNVMLPIKPATPAEDAMIKQQGQTKYYGFDANSGEMNHLMNMAAMQQQTAQQNPMAQFENGKQALNGASQLASNTLADAFNPTWLEMLRLQAEGLLNVANEATGTPSSAFAITKTHREAVWFVQRMYAEVYIPMAILLILPGAVITQMKGLVSFGILSSSNDEDAVSPFSGILRGMIALFLIPATQLICSYSIDVGNSLHHEVQRYIDPGLIFRWADEQVFRAPPENIENSIMDPNLFPVLGKLTQGAEAQSGQLAQSTATAMLQTLANGLADSAAFGLVMLCAFQITMICYMFLMGPIAAAFYAWPAGMGNLFNRVFTTWIDAIINLSLWKFWWTVVLLCITVRLQWIANPATWYSEWELLMFIAFLIILTYVPFNPFDYKAGEMVSKIMSKADAAVNDASKG